MIRTKNVDQRAFRAIQLIHVIRNIRGEIRPCTIRFLQGTVGVVTKFRGPKQQLLAWLPILRLLALGRFQNATIDIILRQQPVNSSLHRASLDQRAFR